MEIKTVSHMCKHVLRNCADSKTKILTFFLPIYVSTKSVIMTSQCYIREGFNIT